LVHLRSGDAQARTRLVELAEGRLRALSATMLHRMPRVQRWEETGDVLGEAATRLFRSLEAVQPDSARHFFRLAATHIRRVLIDMARHYTGPEGLGANHGSVSASRWSALEPHAAAEGEPGSLEEWTAFHERVAALEDDVREVVELLWYHGLTQAEAAGVLGVSERTVKRRWQDARMALAQGAEKSTEPS